MGTGIRLPEVLCDRFWIDDIDQRFAVGSGDRCREREPSLPVNFVDFSEDDVAGVFEFELAVLIGSRSLDDAIINVCALG
jgi:hypothetical protein